MKLTLELYLRVRSELAARGYGGDYTWSENLQPPTTAEALVCEYAWVVLNSGMKNTVARQIMDRVWPRLVASLPLIDVFKHRGKVSAIERAWSLRAGLFTDFKRLGEGDVAVLDWCESLPWIGKITKYHLAKNLGVDVAKPDRWLVRLADADGETVDALCARLALATGDRIATVDVVLWRACAIELLAIEDANIVLRT